jgi:hypothetical protein
VFVAGENVEIIGNNPYNIYRDPSAQLVTLDTATVNLSQSGIGTEASPRVVSGEVVIGALLSFPGGENNAYGIQWDVLGSGTTLDPLVVSAWMTCMICDEAGRADGKVLMMGTHGNYYPATVPTIPPGSLTPGIGLSGDGSAQDPLHVDICSYDELVGICSQGPLTQRRFGDGTYGSDRYGSDYA